MYLKGFLIEVNTLLIVPEAGTDAGGFEGAMAYSINLNTEADLASLFMEMTYFNSEKLMTPLAYVTTTLKLGLGHKNLDKASTETILHAVKTQGSLMLFMLHQKFIEMGITNFFLMPKPDVFFYETIKQDVVLAPLNFNRDGSYDFTK